MRVRDACLIFAWARQWEMKSQFDGDQNKIISCKKKGYLACFTTFRNFLSCHIWSHLFWKWCDICFDVKRYDSDGGGANHLHLLRHKSVYYISRLIFIFVKIGKGNNHIEEKTSSKYSKLDLKCYFLICLVMCHL